MIRILSLFIILQSIFFGIIVNASIIEHNYIDIKFVDRLSKFRSGAGHDYSYHAFAIANGFYEFETDPTETNRSMKHYFQVYEQYREDNLTIPIYAPFDGKIHRVSNEAQWRGYTDKQVWIKSSSNPNYYVIIFHVNLSETFPQIWNDYPRELWEYWEPDDTHYDRITMEAGEIIGYADTRERIGSDIAILQKVSEHEYHYLSYFDPVVMPDSIFQDYVERGVTSRMDLIFSKEFRDANPIPDDYQWGVYNTDDWVILNYVPPSIPATLLLLLER